MDKTLVTIVSAVMDELSISPKSKREDLSVSLNQHNCM